jgi:hypothetical protein
MVLQRQAHAISAALRRQSSCLITPWLIFHRVRTNQRQNEPFIVAISSSNTSSGVKSFLFLANQHGYGNLSTESNPSHLSCGFCGFVSTDWEERKTHVGAHFGLGVVKELWQLDRTYDECVLPSIETSDEVVVYSA